MKHLIIGTAGHVDHGKTALIKLLTGIDCDTHKEEKQRGITINLGFSHITLPSGDSAGIIDVPGHRDFINTMVGGACGIDMVLLVIAADSGIMPQTIEHINIITALGIKKGVVALTKSDLVDKDLLEMAKYEITDYLANTTLKNAPVVGVSAITGEGKDELINTIQTLISEIEETEKSNLFRMYIDRIFTVKGFGSVVTGSVLGGSIENGKDVYLLPSENQKLRIRSIERHGKPVEKVVAGDRAAINLIGLKNEDFQRGMLITDKILKSTEMIDAYISTFASAYTLPLWASVIFISGTYECQARMHIINKDEIKPGQDAVVQIHFSKPGVMLVKDRFIIRNSSGEISLGGGYIIDASPLHHRRRTPALVESLEQLSLSVLAENSAKDSVVSELKKEFRPFTSQELAERMSMKMEEIREELKHSGAGFIVYPSGDSEILIAENYDRSFRDKVLKSLKEYHEKNPVFPDGLESGEIIGKLGLQKQKSGKPYIECLLNSMKEQGQIEAYKNTWIAKGHKPVISKQDGEEIKWLENIILDFADGKPVPSEIEEKAAEKGIPKAKLKMYLSYLSREGKIQFFQSDYIHTSVLKKYRNLLLNLLAKNENGTDIPDLKEAMDVTKKLRAFLLDIFEAEKIIKMQRGGDEGTRIVITETGKKLL